MLVDLKTILSGTREGGYAVGLFNCVTLEMTRGHHRRRGGAAFAGHHRAGRKPASRCVPAGLCRHDAGNRPPRQRAVAVHFDHGFTPELVEEAVSLGFTSVMYDCSMLPL